MVDLRSPYPGLRPFQEEDADYFFGRKSQIDEILERLKSNRFVTVIGGSGSGKSSLVLAGAIPRLRTSSLRRDSALREAGNFWVPVISTPGTNHVDGDNPIRRLARKFCSILSEHPDSDKKNADRLDHCEKLLREPGGFGKLIDHYGRMIKDNDGVDLNLTLPSDDSQQPSYVVKVNFLFLIDQFEELFHPSNETVKEDCQHLVDRIIEQFNEKHPRVCIAITMRSEHLNDCPRYLELPDAINATAYLVKRLNPKEIQEAIKRPAQRFLRRQLLETHQLAEAQNTPPPDQDSWPTEISFDDKVTERLLHDADQIISRTDHADHLPLLQHMLYWIWRSAMWRTKDKQFPDSITMADVTEAVFPESAGAIALDDSLNTLTACLENRCERIFKRHLGREKVWEAVFLNLAFKEPNTGTYTQKRVPFEELKVVLPDSNSSNQALKDNLSPWFYPHQYLFWDEESKTVKVTHESLIRRWDRFKSWVDNEDRRFQVYMKLLEDCKQWRENGKQKRDLSMGQTLRRFVDNRLEDILKDEKTRGRFAELLKLDREWKQLQEELKYALEFLETSIQDRERKEKDKCDREEAERVRVRKEEERERAREEEKRERARKEEARKVKERFTQSQNRFLKVTGVIILVVSLFIFVALQLDAKHRKFLDANVMAAETQSALTSNGGYLETWGGSQIPLSYYLSAGGEQETGRIDESFFKLRGCK